ncbi:putative nucleotidyltransferase-like protein [Lentzea atacamensis]|uniref:Nucleotidyltransferase-like protein n=1 Tax=Lentzea atacamensis TaxID=531938 RepID=A0ABX9DVU9_9PSEU|nr:nucleotidyltransferase family protein [Lentzea atacamensis]RAS59424.1 putative nucleotidyltransferase-like protein [Lentzea atacamensis]
MTVRHTTDFDPDAPGWAVLRALCSLPGPHPDLTAALSGGAALGEALAACVLSKTLCLLAGHYRVYPVSTVPRALAAFLTRTLRANQHKHRLYRREAAALTSALREERARVAVLGGIATDLTVHSGLGVREFGDLDLLLDRDHHDAAAAVLTAFGYQPGTGGSTWTRATGDPVTTLFVVDLHTTERSGLSDTALDRITTAVVPEQELVMPVLAPGDALAASLHRLSHGDRLRWPVVADALRQHHTLPATAPHPVSLDATAADAWTWLRTGWPDLPAYPRAGAQR